MGTSAISPVQQSPVQAPLAPPQPLAATGAPSATSSTNSTATAGAYGAPAQQGAFYCYCAPGQVPPPPVQQAQQGATPPKATTPPPAPKGGPTQSPVQTPPKAPRPPKPVTPPPPPPGPKGGPTQTPPKPPKPVTPPPPPGGPKGGPTQSPVQQSPVQTPPAPPKPPKPPVKGGGGDTSTVRLTNVDKNSMVKLTSSKGNYVQISGDPHVVTSVNGTVKKYDIGYGNGQINLSGGVSVKWDTYNNASHALLNFWIDAPGTKDDDKVATNDGHDVKNQLTVLTDTQLREFIQKLAQYKGQWNQPLHK